MATFQYKDYRESDTVKAAQAALAQQNANKPGAYQSPWQSKINETLGKIENRDKFSYDVNGDALYQQYAQQYAQKGKMAAQDVMGQAAAMTGGYGNSYAATVGNQAYQSYLTEANNAIPTFYQMALDKYTREGQELKDLYSILSDRENVDYSKYRDEVGDWQTERDYLANIYYNERDFDYGKYSDDRDFSYGNFRDDISDQQWEKEYAQAVAQYNANLAYQQERDKVADEQWQKNYDLALKEYDAKYGGNTKTYVEPEPDRMDEENPVYDFDTILNTYIKNGAPKSVINNYLLKAFEAGHIDQKRYNELKAKYAPSGYTY